jgi:hypothetical protein
MAPYVSMLHFLDKIHDNSYYVRSAKIASEIYLLLNEHPNGLEEKPKGEEKNAQLR